MTPPPHPLPRVALAAIFAGILLVTLWLADVRVHWQSTNSGPKGVWLSYPAEGPFERDEWVRACVRFDSQRYPAFLARYRSRSGCYNLLKQVWVDERATPCGQPPRAHGLSVVDPCETTRVLGVADERLTLAFRSASPGPVWLWSQSNDSFDSRHFGPVVVTHRATPLLIAR